MTLVPAIKDRWSARDLDPAAILEPDDLTSILEAGRIAPSWGGRQPVRFFVGQRGDETFELISNRLRRGNSWAKAASVLIAFTAIRDDAPRTDEVTGIDIGLAVGQMIIQANYQDLNAHPIAGFDGHALAADLGITAPATIPVVLVIGKVSAGIEAPQRQQKPLSEVAFARRFGEPFAL